MLRKPISTFQTRRQVSQCDCIILPSFAIVPYMHLYGIGIPRRINPKLTAAAGGPNYGRSDQSSRSSSEPDSWKEVLSGDPLSTDLALGPVEILTYFVRRWQIEVTFAGVRRHLGVETQRQWSDLAIARTTPVLVGLFSLLTLAADRLHAQGALAVRRAAWYEKAPPTFSDALAAVRRQAWVEQSFVTSASDSEVLKLPRATLERLTDALAYAA